MKRVLILSVAALVVAVCASAAFSQTTLTYAEDFEGEFPGVQTIWGSGYDFFGGGNEGTAGKPVVIDEVINPGGFNSTQAFKITVNASNQAGSWGWYYGLGTFLRFSGGAGDGAAQGHSGQDNPANFKVDFDLKVEGNTGNAPVGGEVVLYKPDYEALHAVDLNMDGDMTDGFDTWVSGFTVPAQADSYANYHKVTWALNAGAAPTAPAPVNTPSFDDESTFVLRLFWNNGAFGIDDANVVTLDNVALTFTPPSADFDGMNGVTGTDLALWKGNFGTGTTNAQGDANHDGDVDGDDFLIWQQQLGAAPVAAAGSAIPEPSCLALAAVVVGATDRFRRRCARRR